MTQNMRLVEYRKFFIICAFQIFSGLCDFIDELKSVVYKESDLTVLFLHSGHIHPFEKVIR